MSLSTTKCFYKMIYSIKKYHHIILQKEDLYIAVERNFEVLEKIIAINKNSFSIFKKIEIDSLIYGGVSHENNHLFLNLCKKNSIETETETEILGRFFTKTIILDLENLELSELKLSYLISQIGEKKVYYSLFKKNDGIVCRISKTRKDYFDFAVEASWYKLTPFGILTLNKCGDETHAELSKISNIYPEKDWAIKIEAKKEIATYKLYQNIFVCWLANRMIHGINLETGTILWKHKLLEEFSISFKSQIDAVLIFNEQRFYLLNINSGDSSPIIEIQWSAESTVFGIRHFDNDFFYYERSDSTRYNAKKKFGKIEIATGEIIWEYDVFYPPSAGKNMQLGKMFFQDDGIILGEWLDYTNRENNMLFTFDPEDPENIQYRNEISG